MMPPSSLPEDMDKSQIIGTKHIKESREAYNHVIEAAQKYRDALDLVSRASAEFGGALEQLSHCKGVPDGLQAAAGLYLLVSNHQQILGDTIDKNFVIPVTALGKGLQQRSAEIHSEYRSSHVSKSAELRKKEHQQRGFAKQKRARDLAAYRQSLMEVAAEIDALDALKGKYYQDMWEAHSLAGNSLLGNVSSAVRAEVEIHEGVARKGWSGGGLDELIEESGDPFGEIEKDHLQPIVGSMMGLVEDHYGNGDTTGDVTEEDIDRVTTQTGECQLNDNEGGGDSDSESVHTETESRVEGVVPEAPAQEAGEEEEDSVASTDSADSDSQPKLSTSLDAKWSSED
ncbi:Protein IVY1 [Yarrowia sp. C11]|nr:Protein IVY1 [Yarrowia sp. E02]KAG5373139.1 Protein IVY1 [Yarrowia sp. C11]